jgi:hypothetical protein
MTDQQCWDLQDTLEEAWADAQKFYEEGGKTAEDKAIVDSIDAARELVEKVLLSHDDEDFDEDLGDSEEA